MKHLHNTGSHHKGGMHGGFIRRHKTPSLPAPPGVHPSHAQMNKEHGTPRGFQTSDKGYQDNDPPGSIQDSSDDACNNGSMEY